MSEIMTGTTMSGEIDNEDTMHNKFLVFELEAQQYAIAIEHVTDIINVQPVTRVPSCPDFVCGITNLRGKVIPIIDVRIRFGMAERDYDDRTCIIVVDLHNVSVGMIIDRVSEVITLDEDDIAAPPTFSNVVDVRFIKGIGKTDHGIKLILDCAAVLDDFGIPAPGME
ncbi:MAG: chemotaxis protein CheW [Oscillospiraceae bacterium]|nr:chemotaxis protein CheW [Oscillospiraceae bacterium]